MEQKIDERLQQAAEEYSDLPDSCLEYSDDGWEDKSDWEFVEKAFIAGAQWQKEQYMDDIKSAEDHAYFAGSEYGRKDAIKNATTEELKAELKRRVELAKVQKAEKMENALRCRNCKHCVSSHSWGNFYQCAVRTWGKKVPRHYCVKLFSKACDKFERKIEE